MTRTEERLSAALAGLASQVREETLRPLEPAPRRRFRPVVALAVAGSVLVAVIGIAAGLNRPVHGGPPVADVAKGDSPPPYFVDVEGNWLRVRDSRTGRVTSVIRQPYRISGGSRSDVALAAAADGRSFVFAFNNWHTHRLSLYRFGLTSAGRVTGYTRVPAGALPGMTDLAVAVSPAGRQIVVTGIPDGAHHGPASRQPPRLVVVNARAGSYRSQALSGDGIVIQNLSWSSGGGKVFFMVATCIAGGSGADSEQYQAICSGQLAVAQVWTIAVPPGPAGLGRPRMLMRPLQ